MTDLDHSPSLTALRPLPSDEEAGSALQELQTLLPGRVLLPAHEGWDLARLGWVVSVDQHPIAVVTVHTPDDVVVAVGCAARHGLSVSTQPVGHGATTALSGPSCCAPARSRTSPSTSSVVSPAWAPGSSGAPCSPRWSRPG